MKTKLLSTVAMAGLVMAFATSDADAQQLVFDQPPGQAGGTLSKLADGTFVGTGISFTQMSSVNTPTMSGQTFALTDAVLNFNTDPLTGFITMTGTADLGGNDIGDPIVVSGSFISAGFLVPGSPNFGAFGTDLKDADLAAYFGLEEEFMFSATAILDLQVAQSCDTTANTFECSIIEADFVNIGREAEVPEPATLGLLGAGMLGLGWAARRRKQAA